MHRMPVYHSDVETIKHLNDVLLDPDIEFSFIVKNK